MDCQQLNTLDFAKSLLKNSHRAIGTKTLFTAHDIKNNYFLHEIKLLAKILRICSRDLIGVRNYLNGKMIENIKAKYLSTLDALHNNKVPFHWRREFSELNISFSDYTSFIKSFLRKADAIYGTINNLNLNLPPVIPIGHILDPKAFIMNLLWYDALTKKRSPMDTTISIKKYEGTIDNINKNSWKLNGILIKGGKLDLRSGILYNEAKRELRSELGMLSLEFGSFDRSYVDYIEGEPSVPLYVLPEKYRVSNMEEDFFKQIGGSLHHKEFSRANIIPCHEENPAPAEGMTHQEKSKIDAAKGLVQSEVIGIDVVDPANEPTKDAGPKIPDAGTGNPTLDAGTKRQPSAGGDFKGSSTIFNDADEEGNDVIHIVRLPLLFNAHSYVIPMNDLKFYIYCYSFYSQNYWIEKGTYATIEDIKGRFT